MEHTVNQYQQEAEAKLNNLKRVEYILAAIALLILILEFVFIFILPSIVYRLKTGC